MVSDIHIGSEGSNMAIPIFAKVIEPKIKKNVTSIKLYLIQKEYLKWC